MSKVMAGDVFSCEVCGLAVVVDECGCAMAEIICCEEPMINKGPSTRKKSPPAAKPKKKTPEGLLPRGLLVKTYVLLECYFH